MKTRLLIILAIISVIIVGGFSYFTYVQYTHYKTWANNEHWYHHPDGYDVECEIRLFQSPGICVAFNANGTIVDFKTGLGDWENAR